MVGIWLGDDVDRRHRRGCDVRFGAGLWSDQLVRQREVQFRYSLFLRNARPEADFR